MNLPTLKVMACPVNAGRHPFHDSRWIVTGDAEVEWNTNETEWRLKEGSLVCEMRDCQNQDKLAKLFCAAPELLEALEALLESAKSANASQNWATGLNDEPASFQQARAAIAKARGES